MRVAIVGSSVVACVVLACSARPSSAPSPVAPIPASAAPGASHVLATFEGSFDAATGTFTIATRDAVTGALHTEATLPEGEGAGEVYLHTEGNGDGLTGPTWTPGTDIVRATVDVENGTGGSIEALGVTIAFTPTTVGMREVFPAGGCLGVPFDLDAGGARFGPCNIFYGGVGVDPVFPAPAPHIEAHAAIWVIDDSANAGGDFHFKGSITGEFPTTVAVASSGTPSAIDAPVTFTATVTPVPPATGTPGGWVNFFFTNETAKTGGNLDCNGSGSQQVTMSGGQATCVAPLGAAGTYIITAQYTGDPDGNYTGGDGDLTQVVQ